VSTARAQAEDPALRAEHDALAARLATRQSVDLVRRGVWALFALVIAGGAAGKLAYDRWAPDPPPAFQGAPILLYLAILAALACATLAAVALTRALHHMRVEDAGFARLRELRALLGIDR
jgi:hypothetical protein